MNLIYFTNIKDISWDRIKNNLRLLQRSEVDRIVNLKVERDRCLAIAGKLLLFYVLKQHFDYFKNNLPILECTSFGRPYIKGVPFDFNISHSGEVVVCALALSGYIGVDIEKIKPVNIPDFHIVFRPEELDLICADRNSLSAFYRSWTSKEAVMKADGRGFSLDPVQIFINNNEALVADKRWYLYPLEINEDYISTVASGRQVLPVVSEVLFWSLI
jgi:4'-phosphopantetheinyl transferase